jgi:cytochrome P450
MVRAALRHEAIHTRPPDLGTDKAHAGPLVRIGPNELHCNDPSFIDEIYASSGRKRDKQAHYLSALVGPARQTSFGAIEHDLHRIRRNALNKFFSRAQITRLEPEMRRLAHRLCDKLLSEYPQSLRRLSQFLLHNGTSIKDLVSPSSSG